MCLKTIFLKKAVEALRPDGQTLKNQMKTIFRSEGHSFSQVQ